MKKIFIEKIRVYGHHGCFDEEKKAGQYFLISLELVQKDGYYNPEDDISCTIDYGEVCTLVENIVRDERFNLIESLADKIAVTLLSVHPGLKSVKVTAEKPDAPLPVYFDTVGVTVSRMRHSAFLSLGSNLGAREENIGEAIERIGASPSCKIVKCSDIIETEPWGVTAQPMFLNCALEIETFLEPAELLRALKKIERDIGREEGLKWGPRIIDVDILLYGLFILMSDDLIIPHPHMHERKFVLGPLADIAPLALHPLKGLSISELLESL